MIPNSEVELMVPEGYKPPLDIHMRVLDHALILRRLTRVGVELYLDQHLPDIEGDAREWIVQHYAETRLPQPIKSQPQDGLFAAAMFLAGVSYGDLSLLFGIRKQTVAQKIGRKINETERKTLRDKPAMLDLEVIQLAYTIFNDALKVDPSTFQSVHPLELGRALLKAASALVSEDRGTTAVPDRPRRYANMNISQPEPAPVPEPSEPPAPLLSPEPVTPVPANVLRPEEQDFLNNL